MASVSGIFFGAGLEDRAQTVAQTVEHVADGLAGRHAARQVRPGEQGVADELGGDPGERPVGLKLGVGLGLGIDQPTNVAFDFRTKRLGLFASAQVAGVEAADAGPEFVASGGDRVPSPTENHLGLAGRPVTVLAGGFRLKPPASMTREQPGG